jgi:hypothetical protein
VRRYCFALTGQMPEFLRPKSSESCRILSILNLGTRECFVSPCVKEVISLISQIM